MSATDNWIKLYRWWQEHLKLHFLPSVMNNDSLINDRPSSTSYRPVKDSQLINMKKRSSCAGIDERQMGYNDFRHVRDSIRGTNPYTTRITSTSSNKQRNQFRKATTCDISSDETSTASETKVFPPMHKKRNSEPRRYSLVKFELPSADSDGMKDEQKSVPAPSLNLFQKLLFRQFSPKTRPYSMGISSDDHLSPSTGSDEPLTLRRTSSPSLLKQSWTNSKQNIRRNEDNPSLSPSNKILSTSQQSDLDSYLSKRRNTTGSISLNKIVDTKTTFTGNTLKLTTATNPLNNSNNRLLPEKDIFQTVEESDFLATKQLIKTNENIVNSYNEYDWCPLDIAIMLNNIPMIRLLLHYGANESSKIQPEETRYQSVCQQLIVLLEHHSDERTKKSLSNKLVVDEVQLRRLSASCDKQQRHRRTSKCQQQLMNQQRSVTLTQMKDNYEQAGIPDGPTNVRLMVTGSDNITVTFDEPLRSNGAMVIKYRIEWSSDENFIEISSDVIKNCFLREYIIRNLSLGQKCYVRVSAGNMKGFGETVIANPPYCVPSNWREFSKTSRINICDLRFEEILNKILQEREGIGISRSLDGCDCQETTNVRTRRRSYGNIRKNIRQLFQFYPRLARSMKRGLYLVSVMLNGDRILVTNEDVLPMVEVDENYGHNLLADFQWFMKLTFVWDDLKTLRPDVERCSSATSFYLRIKLVQAAIELQTLEEINNLGRLHHTYIRDHDGNIAFILINDLSSDIRANICPPNLKWIPTTKFLEMIKESPSVMNNSCFQQIIEKLPDMIDFYQASLRRLDAGLYVAYLKMQNSVDSIRVMVNKSMPGSLPCVKIRSIANVSREEWEWLHNSNNESSTDEGLDLFQSQFRSAAKELFDMLDLPETHFSNSRIYDSQVVEIRDDLSLIILMSTADEVNILSSAFNHSLTSFIYLPVYIFEILQHLSNNYRFICQYSRVSICLDFELICAQQNQREAFSMNELDETRYRLNHLLSCQQDLDDIWRLSRWLVHVISCAKDKSYSGISLKSFQPSVNIKADQGFLYPAEAYSIEKSDSGFIDTEDHSIELTVYLSLSTTNRTIPLKLRVNRLTRLNDILEMILKQQQENLFVNDPSFNFVWLRSSGGEYIIQENLTAHEIQKRLLRFGGQVHLRPKDSSLSQSTQTFQNSPGSGSNFTLNV